MLDKVYLCFEVEKNVLFTITVFRCVCCQSNIRLSKAH